MSQKTLVNGLYWDLKFECKKTIHSTQSNMIFSYGLRLTEEDVQSILPYCNALDFEPFRGRKMTMDDAGYLGYRDEIQLKFRAITDSYLPMIELPMDYYYDEAHIWPSEKLYRFLSERFFEGKKKLRGWF